MPKTNENKTVKQYVHEVIHKCEEAAGVLLVNQIREPDRNVVYTYIIRGLLKFWILISWRVPVIFDHSSK